MQKKRKEKVYLTGSSGFVGNVIYSMLLESGFEVLCGDRSKNYAEDLSGFDFVIHLAAKVHDFEATDYKDYYDSNVTLTKGLLTRAIEANVSKFIFISTIKVNGEETPIPYKETKVKCPEDMYGKSKWEAEKIIRELCQNSSTNYTIIRPPLIYGPNVKANFKKLISISIKPIPLPFGNIRSKRSFIFVDNLGSIILKCINSDRANNKTFLVRDDTNLSTKELISKIRNLSGKPELVFKFPLPILRFLFKLIGKGQFYTRLAEGLSIDDSTTRTELEWSPVVSTEEALAKTIKSSLDNQSMQIKV